VKEIGGPALPRRQRAIIKIDYIYLSKKDDSVLIISGHEQSMPNENESANGAIVCVWFGLRKPNKFSLFNIVFVFPRCVLLNKINVVYGQNRQPS
jgi:hypothetical protein